MTRWEHQNLLDTELLFLSLPIVKALIALSWCLGYQAFAGATVLAFFGLGRIGEVLRAFRSDLLLPGTDMWDEEELAFLRLRSSKTATRGRPVGCST